MARAQLILPRADSGCGKVFYDDRRTAYGHLVALEFWNRATGHVRAGYQLAVYRCKRCGGFHIGQKRVESLRMSETFASQHPSRIRLLRLPEESVGYESAASTIKMPEISVQRDS